jgi:ABC-type antimicrobial peptide transport system permease subunit
MPADGIFGNDNYIWNTWYSFELNDTRDENAFIIQYRPILSTLNMNLIMIQSGSENFWESAESILLSAVINMILFTVVLILIFALTSFIYLHQKRRYFAILRAMGNSIKLSIKQLYYPAFSFGLLAIIIGTVLGWLFAEAETSRVLRPPIEISPEHTGIPIEALERLGLYNPGVVLDAGIELSTLWILPIIIILLTLFGLMIFISIKQIAKRPVLELLQGVRAKSKK